MGCNAAKNVAVVPIDHVKIRSNSHPDLDLKPGPIDNNAMVNNVLKAEHGMSFEITFEPDEESAENRLPPKRLLEASDAKKEVISLEKLQEKLDEAETRRQQILQQRVQSGKRLKTAEKKL